jgi:sugar/nucleoside kinase (ribokinase family)
MPLDLLFSVKRYPAPGSKIDGSGLFVQGGGPVPNVLIGLNRMGCSGALITAVGDDVFGRIGVEEMKADGVDTRFVVRRKGSSLLAVGLIELSSGQRTMVLNREIFIRPRDITPDKYPVPRVIHLDGRDLDACIKLARWGRRVAATITFDIGSSRNDVSPIFPLVDHLVVADAFALPFTGKRTVRRALERLKEYCPGTVVVTEGIKGATGLENGSFVHQRAFRVKAIDGTGAGDAFHTGYIYGLLNAYNLKDRLELGAAVAALQCTKMGARTGIPRLPEVRRFLKRKPAMYA